MNTSASPRAGVDGSGIAVDEFLGSIVLPPGPRLVALRQLAQERRGTRLVCDAVGPFAELRRERAVVGATVGRGPRHHAAAIDLPGTEPGLERVGLQVLDEVPEGRRGPDAVAVRGDVGQHGADDGVPGRRAAGVGEQPAGLSNPATKLVSVDGAVDADQLRGWVTEARRLLADSGRSTPGDAVIGSVLAHVPPDGDGVWPAAPLRDLVEDLESDPFESGLRS